MNNSRTSVLSVVCAGAIAALSAGCQIVAVVQPPTVQAGDTVSVGVVCFNSNLPVLGNETDKFVLCAMVPNDWALEEAAYVAVLYDGSPVGFGLGIESPAWADSATRVVPPAAGMKWIGMIADSAYAYTDTLYVTAAVTFRVGSTTGDFPLGYLMTANASGLIDEFARGWSDTAMGNYITVLPATAVEEQRLSDVPQDYSLSQNFPNPFNPSTVIQYTLEERGMVTLGVYDIEGRLLQTLVEGTKEPGTYEVRFVGTNLPSGVYFYRLTAGAFTQTRKMVLTK